MSPYVVKIEIYDEGTSCVVSLEGDHPGDALADALRSAASAAATEICQGVRHGRLGGHRRNDAGEWGPDNS